MRFDWIVNRLKERIYPYTHADAVIMDDEDNRLAATIDVINEKINSIEEVSAVQSDWNENGSSNPSYIKNKPTSLPANGGNADTLDDKHANDFALLSDLNGHIENLNVHISVDGEVGQVLTKTSDGNAWETINNEGIEVVDNLTTDDATKALSAAQGKELKSLIDAGSVVINFSESVVPNNAMRIVKIKSGTEWEDDSSDKTIGANSSTGINIFIDKETYGLQNLIFESVGFNHNNLMTLSFSPAFLEQTYNGQVGSVYNLYVRNLSATAITINQASNATMRVYGLFKGE